LKGDSWTLAIAYLSSPRQERSTDWDRRLASWQLHESVAKLEESSKLKRNFVVWWVTVDVTSACAKSISYESYTGTKIDNVW
jgi:hypothetical protein